MNLIKSGNLEQCNDLEKRGWFIGHFMDKKSGFKSEEFELKWAVLSKGTTTEEAFTITSKTMCVLIDGKFQIDFQKHQKKITLFNRGDFVFFEPNVLYKSEALEDSVVLAIRWPSIPNDKKHLNGSSDID